MAKKQLENELFDEKLKIEEELKEETKEFNSKLLDAQNKALLKDAEINAKLADELKRTKDEAIKDSEQYESLRSKAIALEQKLKEKEEQERIERLKFLEEQAEKQASISNKELKQAEEFIKKAYLIKNAKDRLNNTIEQERDEFKTQQIDFSEKMINKITTDRSIKSKRTEEILDRIHLQKEFVKTRYEKDKRITESMKERANARMQELTQSIKMLEAHKKALLERDEVKKPVSKLEEEIKSEEV